MSSERITREELLIQIAALIAKRSTCGRLHVGCVIARDGRIVVTGYNGPVKGEAHCKEYGCDLEESCQRAIHAEANAIAYAARFGIPLEGCEIYCTHAPCLKCAELIIQAGIRDVIFLEDFRTNLGIEKLLSNSIGVIRL